MTELKKGYDSLTNENCTYCGDPILIDQARIVYGVGSLVIVYHPACWQLIKSVEE